MRGLGKGRWPTLMRIHFNHSSIPYPICFRAGSLCNVSPYMVVSLVSRCSWHSPCPDTTRARALLCHAALLVLHGLRSPQLRRSPSKTVSQSQHRSRCNNVTSRATRQRVYSSAYVNIHSYIRPQSAVRVHLQLVLVLLLSFCLKLRPPNPHPLA